MKYLKRGSRWAAAMTALGFVLVGGFPGAANAQVVACFDHGAWYNDGPSGHGSANGTSVTLNPFNPAWDTGTRWESLTLYGEDGLWFTQDLPVSGVFQAPGGVLTGWRVCKGVPDAVTVAVTTTVAAPTTTAASSVTTPALVPVTTTSTVPAAPGVPTTTAPPAITTQRLPETGRSGLYLLLATGFAAASIGGILMWIRRRPA